MSNSVYNEKLIIGYILGNLSEAETERLDELSIVSDDFSHQLKIAENDLIDAFARGELKGHTLDQFRKRLMVTPRQRERVDFAVQLSKFVTDNSLRTIDSSPTSWRKKIADLIVPSFFLRIVIPTTAFVSVIISFILFRERDYLNDRLERLDNEKSAILKEKEKLNDLLALQENRFSEAINVKQQLKAGPETAYINFKPGLSGVGDKAVLVIQPSVNLVSIRLEFESDNYPDYYVKIYSRNDHRQIWNSQSLTATTKGGSRILTLQISASLFESKGYILDLNARTTEGSSIELSSNLFTVVKR